MDRFDCMRVFARVLERRSFTAAAEDMKLPRSTVTDAVKQLEARLGVRLLQRTTRTVTPTLDGEAYYRSCLSILAEIEAAESTFLGSRPKGLLRVDVHGTLARHFVLPHLPEFLRTYPEIELFLSEGDRLVDLVREGIDCVLRVGIPQDSEMIARRIVTLPEVTLASPGYLEAFGTPETLEDLVAHRMIGFRSSATGGVLPLVFAVNGKMRETSLPMALSVSAAESYYAACLHGLGLIQIPRYHAEPALGSGELVEVLPGFKPPSSPVSVLYPRDRQLAPRVRVFIDWLVHIFADAR
ncbi:DNA-binding transcriptional regulator, LysR family [Devosia crocina]|uniref:DNA-binding transcriptional regulator, LysR family n=1 Tax=Devosia crocina TaxID=429728 RepID=A0A1I7N891_9HYPH|nr:LysR family transcriptional regulator [Devosia crocina]SFV30858.1 DNA-binding transcriptional regulator, LysR family [Devosia crocina]